MYEKSTGCASSKPGPRALVVAPTRELASQVHAEFEVLAQLAAKTQVLFFTHHRHLVDIAQSILGKAMHVVSIADS